MAATVLFAGSTSGEAEHVSQGDVWNIDIDMDMDIYTGIRRTLAQLVKQAATDKVLPSTAPRDRTCIKHNHIQASSLLLLA